MKMFLYSQSTPILSFTVPSVSREEGGGENLLPGEHVQEGDLLEWRPY